MQRQLQRYTNKLVSTAMANNQDVTMSDSIEWLDATITSLPLFTKALQGLKQYKNIDGYIGSILIYLGLCARKKSIIYLKLFVDQGFLKILQERIANFKINYFKYNNDDYYFLHELIQANYTEVLEYILDNDDIPYNINGVKHNQTLLSCAISYGHHKIVKLLIEHKANINLGTEQVVDENFAACAPLFVAIWKRDLPLVEVLLTAGASKNATQIYNNQRYDLLAWAAAWGDSQIYNNLISAGVTQVAGAMPVIFAAALNSDLSLFKQLLTNLSEQPQLFLEAGEMLSLPAFIAKYGKLAALQALLAADVNVSHASEGQLLPINAAIIHNQSKILELLLTQPVKFSALQRQQLLSYASKAETTTLKTVYKFLHYEQRYLYDENDALQDWFKQLLTKQDWEKVCYLLRPKHKITVHSASIMQQNLFYQFHQFDLNYKQVHKLASLLFNKVDTNNYLAVMLDLKSVLVKQEIDTQIWYLMQIIFSLSNLQAKHFSAANGHFVKYFTNHSHYCFKQINLLLNNNCFEERQTNASDDYTHQLKLLVNLMRLSYPNLENYLSNHLHKLITNISQIHNKEYLNQAHLLLQNLESFLRDMVRFSNSVKALVKHNEDYAFNKNFTNSIFLLVNQAKSVLNQQQKQMDLLKANASIDNHLIALPMLFNENLDPEAKSAAAAEVLEQIQQCNKADEPVVAIVEKKNDKIKKQARKAAIEQRNKYFYHYLTLAFNQQLNIHHFPGNFYLTGGAPLDLLLGKDINDFDCLYQPAQTAEDSKAIFTQQKFQVSPYRSNLYTFQGIGHLIDVTLLADSRPNWLDTYWHNCDFTICALFIHLDKTTQAYALLDPSQMGINDAKERRLRMIGVPIQRFTEDPIRILRAIKYIADGFNPDAPLHEALLTWDNQRLLQQHRTHLIVKTLSYLNRFTLVADGTKLFCNAFVEGLQQYGLLQRLFNFEPAANVYLTTMALRDHLVNLSLQTKQQINQPLRLFAHLTPQAAASIPAYVPQFSHTNS